MLPPAAASSNQVLQLRQQLLAYIGALVEQARAQVKDADASLNVMSRVLVVRLWSSTLLLATMSTAIAAQS